MQFVESLKSARQNVAETAATYRFGQAVIKQLDRALWTVEKSARWAVPPALEQDEEKVNSPELVRPLPWLLFLWVLIVLRVTREVLSVVNLVMGKPPVRAADIVTYIQSKRRYLRALKYQGSRNMRARANNVSRITFTTLKTLQSNVARALCFRQQTAHSNDTDEQVEQVGATKSRGVKDRESGYASPAQDENTMEKLIEKMVDICYDSSDDSEYTLTNATSVKSDSSIISGDDSILDKTATRPEKELVSSTPNKPYSSPASPECSNIQEYMLLDSNEKISAVKSLKNESMNLIASERQAESTLPKAIKMANGQAMKTSKNTKRDNSSREDSDVPVPKMLPADESNTNGSTEA